MLPLKTNLGGLAEGLAVGSGAAAAPELDADETGGVTCDVMTTVVAGVVRVEVLTPAGEEDWVVIGGDVVVGWAIKTGVFFLL
jgi:hypothetical protein